MKRNFTWLFVLAVLTLSADAAAQNGLFISEVADPGDEYTGRFIELFNAGSETVDFNTDVFYLARQSNGGSSWGTVQLTGSVAPGRTYVIGGSAFESLYGFAPDLVTGILTGNGDDPYSLYSGGDHETGIIHDIYGERNTDGTGEPWEYTDSRAVRNGDVEDPRILWSAGEWTIMPADIADCDPGTHHGSGGGPIIPEGDFALAVVSDTAEIGQAFYLAIATSELAEDDDIISFQFDVDFDPAILEFLGTTVAGTLGDGGTLAENVTAPGELSVSFMHTEPMTGAGDILLIQFNALVMGTSEVRLSNAFLNNIPVAELFAGQVLVAETSPPEAAVTYSDTINRLSDMLQITATFSEEISPANPVYLNLDGAVTETGIEMVRISDTSYSYLYFIPRAEGTVFVSFSNGTDLHGNEVVAQPVSGGSFDIIGLRPGDVNDDGTIHAYDAALALQHSVGLDPLPDADPLPWEAWRDSTANVDRSGVITAYDAGLILQYSAGIISAFPAETSKTIEMQDIIVEQTGDALEFFAGEALVGLNLSVEQASEMLGEPEVIGGDFLSAINTAGDMYRVGLCAGEPPAAGTAVLRIPVLKGGVVVLELNVNGQPVTRVMDLTTGVGSFAAERIGIYPNPVRERLTVDGLEDGVVVVILDSRGAEVDRVVSEGRRIAIDVAGLEAGMYLLHIRHQDAIAIRRMVKY